MRWLFCSPPVTPVRRPQGELPAWVSSPPLGLNYLVQMLRQAGHGADAVDYAFTAPDQIARDLAARAADVIGIPCFTERRAAARDLAALVRRLHPRALIVMGGAHATLLPEQVLRHYPVDIVIRGEAERTVVELAGALAAGRPYDGIPGLAFLRDGKFVQTPDRPLIADLDTLPFPDYALFDHASYADRYLDARGVAGEKRAVVVGSRGCVYQCRYCATALFWQHRIRFRSAENIVEELARLHRDHGVTCVSFADDAFTLDPRRVLAFCDELHRRALPMRWSCIGRVSCSSRELYAAMRAAGCFAVTFGVESAAPAVLERMRKQITPDDIIRAFADAGAAGLFREMLLMVGNPGETRATIGETIRVMRAARPDDAAVNLTTVYPGTELYADAVAAGLLDDAYWLSDLGAPYYTVEHSYPWLVGQGTRIIAALRELQRDAAGARRLRIAYWRDRFAYHTGWHVGKRGLRRVERAGALRDNWL